METAIQSGLNTKYIRDEIVKNLTENNIRLQVYILNLISGYREDVVGILNKFFPSEKVGKAVAKVLKLEFAGYELLEKHSVKDFMIKDNLLYNINDRYIYTYIADIYQIEAGKKQLFSYGKEVKGVKIIPKSLYDNILNQQKADDTDTANMKIKNIIEKTKEEEVGKKVFEYIVEQAIYHGASDVHIEYTGKTGTVIRFRVGGTLEAFCNIPSEIHYQSMNYLKTIINKSAADRETRKDGRINMLDTDIRVVIMPSAPYVYDENTTNERAVLRVLRKNNNLVFGLENLPLNETELEIVKKAINVSYGMILTSGPTSSGKTTTLYALLSNIDAMSKKIITLEDPIEFLNPYLWQQHQVSEKMTFDEILKGILREDPDVCLIGEIRDLETARKLVELANTGHLTFSTIHANNSYDIVRRLSDMTVDESAIRDFGVLFIAQRLLRKSCPHCRYTRKISKVEKELLKIHDIEECVDNKGCQHCKGTGAIKQRIMIMEILPVFYGDTHKYLSASVGYIKLYDEYLEPTYGIKRLAKKAIELNKQGIVSMTEIIDKVK